MDIKKHLDQILFLNELIHCKLQQIKDLKSLLDISGIDYSKEKIKTNNNNAKFTSIINKIVDLENSLQDNIISILDLQDEFKNIINLLDDRTEKLILYYKYLNLLSTYEIEEKLNISRTTFYKKYKNALKNIEKIEMNKTDYLPCK